MFPFDNVTMRYGQFLFLMPLWTPSYLHVIGYVEIIFIRVNISNKLIIIIIKYIKHIEYFFVFNTKIIHTITVDLSTYLFYEHIIFFNPVNLKGRILCATPQCPIIDSEVHSIFLCGGRRDFDWHKSTLRTPVTLAAPHPRHPIPVPCSRWNHRADLLSDTRSPSAPKMGLYVGSKHDMYIYIYIYI